jgi:hypothetical protein
MHRATIRASESGDSTKAKAYLSISPSASFRGFARSGWFTARMPANRSATAPRAVKP